MTVVAVRLQGIILRPKKITKKKYTGTSTGKKRKKKITMTKKKSFLAS